MSSRHYNNSFGVVICGREVYFVASSGNVTDEVILEYIKNQDKEGTDDNFQIGRD